MKPSGSGQLRVLLARRKKAKAKSKLETILSSVWDPPEIPKIRDRARFQKAFTPLWNLTGTSSIIGVQIGDSFRTDGSALFWDYPIKPIAEYVFEHKPLTDWISIPLETPAIYNDRPVNIVMKSDFLLPNVEPSPIFSFPYKHDTGYLNGAAFYPSLPTPFDFSNFLSPSVPTDYFETSISPLLEDYVTYISQYTPYEASVISRLLYVYTCLDDDEDAQLPQTYISLSTCSEKSTYTKTPLVSEQPPPQL